MKSKIVKTEKKKTYKNYFLMGLFVVTIPLMFLLWKNINDIKNKPVVFQSKEEVPVIAAIAEKLPEKPVEEIIEATIAPPKPLADPPKEIKAIYATSWSASSVKRIDGFIDLIKKSELNAIVIDIKDYSGGVFYDTDIDEVIKYKAKQVRISKIDDLIKKFHDNNIYVIARIAVFQDPILAGARPDIAVKNSITGKIWKDRKGLAWVDPAARDAWDYNVKIAQEASGKGFDEINFDYIRFPSDGNLSSMAFPFYDPKKMSKKDSMKEFYAYLRSNLKDVKISADLFGLATVNEGDLGIGQVIEDAYENFDYVSPMVYPSHYATGFMGYKNPAAYPYEVVKYSIESASKKLTEYNAKQAADITDNKTNIAKIRPWLQAFDMGAKYGAKSVDLQIKASDESGGTGWMLWSPTNIYTGRVTETKK